MKKKQTPGCFWCNEGRYTTQLCEDYSQPLKEPVIKQSV